MCPAPREDRRNVSMQNNHQASNSSSENENGENGNGDVSYEQMGYALIQGNDDADAQNGDYINVTVQNGTSLLDDDSEEDQQVSSEATGNSHPRVGGEEDGVAAQNVQPVSTSDPLSFRDLDRMTEFELGSRSGGAANSSELWAPVRDNTQVELWNWNSNSTSNSDPVESQDCAAAGMSNEQVETIKSIMSRIRLPDSAVPGWAKTVPENEWTALIRHRRDADADAHDGNANGDGDAQYANASSLPLPTASSDAQAQAQAEADVQADDVQKAGN